MEKTAGKPTKSQHRGAEEMMATFEPASAAPAPTACSSEAGWYAITSRPPALQRSPNKSGRPHLPPAGKRDRGPNLQGPVQPSAASSGAATAFKSMAYDLKVPKTPGARSRASAPAAALASSKEVATWPHVEAFSTSSQRLAMLPGGTKPATHDLTATAISAACVAPINHTGGKGGNAT